MIILTAHGSIPEAVSATQEGVFSFLTKPVDRDTLYRAIDEALALIQPASDERWREAIVTRSPLMLRLLEQAKMVAQSDVSILLSGQSGQLAHPCPVRGNKRRRLTGAAAGVRTVRPCPWRFHRRGQPA